MYFSEINIWNLRLGLIKQLNFLSMNRLTFGDARSLSGIATSEGPLPVFKVEELELKNLETFLSSIVHIHTLAIVKMSYHQKLGMFRPFREKRCILGINDLPEEVNENFLDYFCKNKTFVLFDFRNEGVIIEQVIDQIVRFTSLISIVLVLVEEGVFGAAIERRLVELSKGK